MDVIKIGLEATTKCADENVLDQPNPTKQLYGSP